MKIFGAKKWLEIIICVLILMSARAAFAAGRIDAIADLQEQRVNVCKELVSGDDKSVIKALKETGDLIEKQIKQSADPEFSRRAFTPATRKLDLIYQADKVRKPQINYMGDVYRAALAGLRVQYRDEIRRQILEENNLKSDFFENDCRRLLK